MRNWPCSIIRHFARFKHKIDPKQLSNNLNNHVD